MSPPKPQVFRRKTLMALGLLAAVAILATLTLLVIWKRAFAEIDGHFLEQSLAWSESLGEFIAGEVELAQTRPDGRPWTRRFEEVIPRKLEVWFRRRSDHAPRDLALSGTTLDSAGPLVLLGENPVLRGSRQKINASRHAGFAVWFEPAEKDLLVHVHGPLRRGETTEELRLAATYGFPRLGFLDRGRFYLLLLLSAFLTWLYVILVVVYVMGRREERLLFTSREREIRLRAMSAVAEGIAHDVRNPLNALSLQVQYIEKLPEKTGQRPSSSDFALIHAELTKIQKVVGNFVGFAKQEPLRLANFELTHLLNESVEQVQPLLKTTQVDVEMIVAGPIVLEADRAKLGQVFQTVMTSAIHAMSGAAERKLKVAVQVVKTQVSITFEDSGPTPGDSALAVLFEPYNTARSSTIGLGMTLARTVIESHGGTVSARAGPTGGCQVSIVLPR